MICIIHYLKILGGSTNRGREGIMDLSGLMTLLTTFILQQHQQIQTLDEIRTNVEYGSML
jgi:hypothetical protein